MKGWATYLMTSNAMIPAYKLFRVSVYTFVVLTGVWKLIGFSLVYGPNSFVPPFPYDEGVLSAPFHLAERFQELAPYGYAIYLLCAGYLIFRSRFWMTVLVWILHLNFYNAGFLIMNGGDMLLSNVLLFLCIPAWDSKNNLLVNTGMWFVRLQIVVIYLVSFLYKLEGSDWINGLAIGKLSENSVFGMEGLDGHSPVFAVLTYLVLFHQGLFPFLVWFRKIRPHILVLGIAIHLGIVVFMGLIDFGLIMILCYLPFLNDAELRKLQLLPGILPGKKRLP